MALEQRHVLERCRVEDHVRPHRHEDVLDQLAVADVGEDLLRCGRKQMSRVMEVRLVVVENDQCGRVELRDLPCNLGADRTAAARHEDAPPSQQCAHHFEVDLDLFAAK